MIVPVAEIRVCVDCALLRECDVIAQDREQGQPEPWSKLPDADVANVSMDEPEFSHADCDACGSTLAGDRYDYVVFRWSRNE